MSITVVTSDPITTPVTSDAAKVTEKTETATSALEAKASEQEVPAESDTADTEAKTEEDESDEGDKDAALDSDESDKDKPKKKGGFQRRIDKLNSRIAERDRELEYLRKMAVNTARPAEAEKTVETKMEATDGKPNPDTFDTHAEYVEAVAEWKFDQKQKQLTQEQQRVARETEYTKTLQAYSEREKSFEAIHGDYREVLESVDTIPLTVTVKETIVTSDVGPALAYELAKNPKELERIVALGNSNAAARELGKIEARLESKATEKQEPKKTTKAPEPISPVGSKGASVEKSIFDPEISQRDYERLRAKQRTG